MVEYIYLLQEREFVKSNENIYKIGKTRQPNLARVSQYPNGTILIIQSVCINCTKLEKELIAVFKNTFQLRKDIGDEYFQGNCFEMRRLICKYIEEEVDDKHHFVCEISKKYFITNSNLLRHIDEFHKEPATENKCVKCCKTFSRKWSLTQHFKICKGIINKLECEYCKLNFKHERSRFRHYKTCATKKETLSSKREKEIIRYNQYCDTQYISDDVVFSDFQNILMKENLIIYEYVKLLLLNPENCCIKKSNLKIAHSKIHTGNNNWIIELDKVIYPKLILDVSKTILEYMEKHKELLDISMYETVKVFLETLNEKPINREYRHLVQSLKLAVYAKS